MSRLILGHKARAVTSSDPKWGRESKTHTLSVDKIVKVVKITIRALPALSNLLVEILHFYLLVGDEEGLEIPVLAVG